MRIAADGGVGRGNALSGVDDQQRDVGGLEMAARHDDGELLRHHLGLALAADSGGVDEAKRPPWYSMTSSTASRVVPAMGETMAREEPVRALSSVALADIGAADDGDLGFVLLEFAMGAVRLRRRLRSPRGSASIGVAAELRHRAAPRRLHRAGRRCRVRVRRRWEDFANAQTAIVRRSALPAVRCRSC